MYREDLISYSIDFSYFPMKKILNIAEDGQNRSKFDLLKRVVEDGFSYFSLIFSYFNF